METRAERIAGNDRKITQADIQRLESGDPHGDLRVAREILPPDFFRQLEEGKWFGIGEGSALGRGGYIEKLNQIGGRYEQEREAVEQESSQALGNMELGSEVQVSTTPENLSQFTRTLRLTSPYLQGADIRYLQEKLTAAGYNTQGVDGIFGRNTQQALISYQQQVLGQRGDGVMDFGGATMQSFGQEEMETPTQRSPREDTPVRRVLPEARDEVQRTDIQQALQANGVVNPEVVARVQGSLVTLTSGLGAPRGSGSFIAPNMILTAEHVIRDLETLEYRNIIIRDAAGNRYDIVQMYIDPSNNDIAFIETRQSSQNYLPLAQGNVEARVNQEGVLLGFHQNRPRFQRTQTTERMEYTETRVHPRFEDVGQDFGYFDALPGDSGGPIILSDGTIGGMAIERYEEGGQGTIYETAQYIQSIYNQIT